MKRETIDEWEAWEYWILKDLKAIDRKIQQFYKKSAFWGDPKAEREKFVIERLKELIKQSVEGRA